jgi:hypothetical protein
MPDYDAMNFLILQHLRNLSYHHKTNSNRICSKRYWQCNVYMQYRSISQCNQSCMAKGSRWRPVVTFSVNDMFADPSAFLAKHLYWPLSSMSTLVSVRLVFMYPELIEVVTPSTSFCHTRLVTLGYASVLHINVTLSVTFTANSVSLTHNQFAAFMKHFGFLESLWILC